MENKLNLFLALHSHYSYAETKDSARLAKLAAGINKMCDELTKDVVTDQRPAGILPENQNKNQNKSGQENKPANNGPAPKTQKEIDALKDAKAANAKAEAEAAEKAKKEKEEKAAADAKLAEVLLEVFPFYACEVTPKGAKFAKSVKVHAPRSFKAYEDEAAAKAAKIDTLYPDLATLELVLDEAWEMACRCESSKAILEMCKKELGSFYPELKADSDWYAKLVNPIVGMVGFIKKAFGYKADDKTVIVTRPTEKSLTLGADSDCIVKKDAPAAAAAPKVEEKKELKTTQTASTAKAPATKVETPDEDDDASLDLDEDEAPARDTSVPPEINDFDNFNAFETMVFEKLLEGAKLAKDAKDEASKNTIKSENKEEVRNLIASNFEDEPWTIKTEDGKWNPLLINYHNAIIKEISENKEKWAKK